MLTRALARAGLIGASVLTGSCVSTHATIPPPIAITIQVAPPPASSRCSQNQLTFAQASPTGPQYVTPCGDIDLSSFSGGRVDISMSIVSPGFAFYAAPGKDSLDYAEKHGDTKHSVSPGSRFPNGVKHGASASDISFTYNSRRECSNHSYCPRSAYGIFLSKNGSYLGEVEPIIVNQP